MGVVQIQASDILKFIEDEFALKHWAKQLFDQLDVDGDGYLSKSELRCLLEQLHMRETSCGAPVNQTAEELDVLYGAAFDQFDANKDGRVSFEEFNNQIRAMYEGMARSLAAVQVLVDQDGFLQPVVKHMQQAVY